MKSLIFLVFWVQNNTAGGWVKGQNYFQNYTTTDHPFASAMDGVQVAAPGLPVT